MSSSKAERIEELQSNIAKLKLDIRLMENILKVMEEELHSVQSSEADEEETKEQGAAGDDDDDDKVNSNKHNSKLGALEIERYSRQLILPCFGVKSQLKLRETSCLIVGMGGLGCPAAQYLAAAGCGRIGLVDYDLVERVNLHRQVLHTTKYMNLPKVFSAEKALEEINPHIKILTYNTLLKSDNIMSILNEENYDIILDCTDNVATRYLLNDACVLTNKPLVSGSAIQFDGQLTVYHYGDDSPCYRCLYPVPPPPEAVTNCGDGGVLGAVTGVIGSLQALEAIKIACGLGDVYAGRLLIFEGLQGKFRQIKLRGKRLNCDVCSANPMIRQLIDYEQFCGMRASDKDYSLSILDDDERITVEDYRDNIKKNKHLLVDVRSPNEFEMCHLPESINMPLKSVLNDEFIRKYTEVIQDEDIPIVLLCRRGNDSQIAAHHIKTKLPDHNVFDIIGGLHAWHHRIDNEFPIY